MARRTGRAPRLEQHPLRGVDAVTWLTLYVVLLFAVPSKLVLGPLGSAGAPSMLMGLGSLLLWIMFRAGTTRRTPMRAQPIRIALLGFLLSVGTTYALAMARPLPVDEISPADVALLTVCSWTGTLLVAHDGVLTRGRLDTLVWRLSVCGGALALLGVLQVLTGQIWVDRISIPGLTLTEAAGTYSRNGFLRPAGTAVHPIEFGALVTVLLPIALHVGFTQSSRGRLVRWLPAAAIAAVVPVTSSRSAYLGALVGLLVCVVGWPRARRRLMLVLVAAGVAVASVAAPNLFRSIVNLFSGVSEDPSIASRTGSFDLAGEFIARHPYFGRGLGTFLPKYRIFDNQYLVLLVTIGIIGTVAFLLLGVVAIMALLRTRRLTSDEGSRDLALSLVASLVVGFVSLAMFDAFSFPMTMGALFLILGIAGAFRRLERASLERTAEIHPFGSIPVR